MAGRRPRKPLTLAQRRANPGLRAKLPASQLTSAQRAERQRLANVAKRNADPLYNPGAGLSGQTLYAAAKHVTDAQIDPKVDALTRDLTSTTTQGSALAGRAGDYYRQLAQEEAGKVATQKALAGMLSNQTSQVGAQTQAAFAQMGQAEQQRQASDVALRGAGLGGDVSMVPEEIAARRGTAATLQQGAGDAAASQGSEWAQLANAMAQGRSMRGGEVQGQLLNRVANQQQQIRGQIADTESTRGDTFAKNLLDLRQQQFENAVTTQGLNIKQSDIDAQLAGIKQRGQAAAAKTTLDTKKFKADQAYKQAQIDIKRGIDPVTGKPLPRHTSAADALNKFRLDYAKKHGYLPKTGPPSSSSGGGLTPAQQAAAGKQWAAVQNGLAQVSGASSHVPVDRNNQITNVPKGARLADGSPDPRAAVRTRPATMNESVAALRRAKTPEWAVQAILSIRHHGYVLPSVQQMIAQAAPNVRIPDQYLRPPRRPRGGIPAGKI